MHMVNGYETITNNAVAVDMPSPDDLYDSVFPAVAALVGKLNGSLDDARDLFHDALIIYFEKINTDNFALRQSAGAYIMGIVKHLAIRKFTRARALVSLDVLEQTIVIPEDFYPNVITVRLLTLMERTGEKCLQLLKAFYSDKLTGEAIAQRFGYSSRHSATVQKYKCIEKTRDYVKSKNIRYEDFLE